VERYCLRVLGKLYVVGCGRWSWKRSREEEKRTTVRGRFNYSIGSKSSVIMKREPRKGIGPAVQ
jgi:hypothetical protein